MKIVVIKMSLASTSKREYEMYVDLVVRARLFLMETFPFLAPFVILVRYFIVKTDIVPTAAVDEYGNILINPDFIKKLVEYAKKPRLLYEFLNVLAQRLFKKSNPRRYCNFFDTASKKISNDWKGRAVLLLAFVILHEILHFIRLHHPRGKNKEKTLWNVATDTSINGEIITGFRLPAIPGTIIDINWEGESPEEIYKKLLKFIKEMKKRGIGEGQISSTCPTCGETIKGGKEKCDKCGTPRHITPKEAAALPENKQKSVACGGDIKDIDKHKVADIAKKKGQTKDIFGDRPNDRKTIGDLSEVKRRIRDAAFSAESIYKQWEQKMAGVAPGFIERTVKIFLKRREVNWRQFLKMFITETIMGRTGRVAWQLPKLTYTYTYKKYGIFIPARKEPKKVDVIFFIDSSGSISDKEYSDFVSEIFWAKKTYGERANFWVLLFHGEMPITKFYGIPAKKLRKPSDILKHCGKREEGGTVFKPIMDWLEHVVKKRRVINRGKLWRIENPVLCAILTDGENFDGNNLVPKRVLARMKILWILSNAGKEPSKFKQQGYKVKIKGS